jgi:hypothetical protein
MCLAVFALREAQNTDVIGLHNTAHANYDNCKSILTNSPAAKLKGDMALHFVDEATAFSVLDTSAIEGVDATLIAAMWAAESSSGLIPLIIIGPATVAKISARCK